MKRIILLSMLYALCALPLGAVASTNSIAAVFRWNIDTQKTVDFNFPNITRGESINLEPSYISYGVPVNLASVHLVMFRYRPKSWPDGSAYSIVTGEVANAAAGMIRIPWDSSREFTNSAYIYELAVQSTPDMNLRGRGSFSLVSSIAAPGAGTTNPVSLTSIDWARVDHSNVGSAPFLSTFQIDDIQDELFTLFDGTADAHVNSITSDVPYQGSAADLSDFPAYLARTTDIPTGVITNAIKGQDEAVGRIERVDQHNISVHFPIVGEGEIATTNRLYWIVDGQAVGYVSTNGITMIKGSLQLYEEDLNCNLRAYDGAKAAPSVTFYSSPFSGWYRKSVAGAGAWAYAHNTNDVGYINNSGWMLLGTREYTGYGAELDHCNVTSAYQINGTNGRTTNLNVIISGGATQTLRFVGGLLQP